MTGSKVSDKLYAKSAIDPSMPPPDPSQLRETFLKRMGPETPIYHLFDRIPGVSFFAKDRQFRIVCANDHFIARFGFSDEIEIIGKDDFQLFPERLAENFRRDDAAVMTSGQPKSHIVELFFNRQGVPDWYVTDKMPVKDRSGKIIGVMGIVRAHGSAPEEVQTHQQIAAAVEHIRQRFRQKISIEELAERTGLSERQLHRKFVAAFGMSPQAVIMKLRIQAACELLRDPDPQLSEIAASTGFVDQSAFTQHFQKHMGTTPRRYRQRF